MVEAVAAAVGAAAPAACHPDAVCWHCSFEKQTSDFRIATPYMALATLGINSIARPVAVCRTTLPSVRPSMTFCPIGGRTSTSTAAPPKDRSSTLHPKEDPLSTVNRARPR